jgi:hypothetical protein
MQGSSKTRIESSASCVVADARCGWRCRTEKNSVVHASLVLYIYYIIFCNIFQLEIIENTCKLIINELFAIFATFSYQKEAILPQSQKNQKMKNRVLQN